MRLRVFALSTAVLLAVAGCSDSPAPPRPGVLMVGMREPATLLPADVHDQAGRLVTGALWTPLADYDAATGKLTPRAAESISSVDQVRWTVKLRTGGQFTDATPVTAKSYVDTWRAIGAEHWAASTLLTDTLHAKEITATDDGTITLLLDRAFGQLPAVLSSPSLVPMPASVLASHDWAGFARQPIGNGPFRLDGPWQPGTGGKLVRVSDAPGRAREVELKVGDPTAQYDDVKAGRLDLAAEVPGDRHEAMYNDFVEQRRTTWPLPEASYLGFPLTDKRFQDATVRHGFALAVDRAALETGPLGDQVDRAHALLPPADAPGARSGTCRPCAFDVPAAKSLLSQAGFSGAVSIYFGAGDESWARPLSEQVRGALAVDTVARPRPTGTVDGPFTLSVTLSTPSPHELLAGLAKATGYTDDGFAQLLAAADAAATADESGRMYRLAENQLLRDLPAAPLWSGHGHAVWAERVRGVVASPFVGVDLSTVSL